MNWEDWEKKHKAGLNKYAKQIAGVYRTAAVEAAAIGATISDFDPSKPFSFTDYPQTKARLDKLVGSLHNNIETTIVNGIDAQWTLSNNKNNELCNRVFGNNIGKLTKNQERQYYSNNERAREAFKARKVNGLGLSESVWKYTDQFKAEIELGLDLGMRDGLSATAMARELKQYLQQPDKLFRRVRDEHGQLHLSKAAKAYHPGRGVYRSSYKNALRLTSTENNIAYRSADHERWQQLDFVVGIEVRKSNNHPVADMCDALAGKYPKDFKFTGWHPNCRCHAVPILQGANDFMAGKPITEQIENTPSNYNDWVEQNKDRFTSERNTPYFIRDNFKDGKISEGSRFANKLNGEMVTTIRDKANAIVKSSSLNGFIEKLETSNVDYNDVKVLSSQLTETEIISRVGGGDLTKGSCSSLAFTYAGNKCGFDVLDFRDGASRQMFGSSATVMDIAEKVGGVVNKNVSDFTNAKVLLSNIKDGREYYFACGRHAAIVRKTPMGYEYLELQSATDNGFKPLDVGVLKRRFDAKKSHTSYGSTYEVSGCAIDTELLKNDTGFKKMMGYINTNEYKQTKGSNGTIR